MKKQAVIDGIAYIILSDYKGQNYRRVMFHDFGLAFLSPDKQLGFVQHLQKWLMFRVKDYETARS